MNPDLNAEMTYDQLLQDQGSEDSMFAHTRKKFEWLEGELRKGKGVLIPGKYKDVGGPIGHVDKRVKGLVDYK